MKPLLTLLLCVTVSMAFSQQGSTAGVKPVYKFVLLAHGLSAPKKPVTHLEDSAWGDEPYQYFKVIKTTDSVPAVLNTVFGIQYKLTGTQNSEVHYTTEWVYPYPLKESDGKKYKSYKSNGTIMVNEKNDHNNSFSYVLERTNELLKGTWTLNVYIEDKLMYSHLFLVY